MASGRFITLEGGEGAGKSTQIKRLAAVLEEAGRTVLVTREPGGSPGAEDIRKLLVEGDPGRWSAMTEALLHFAARKEHLRQTVEPALAREQWVICDRFADSTLAYQGYGHELGAEPIAALYRLVVGGFRPDLTLILDLPPDIGLARTGGRAHAEDRYERMNLAFHQRVRAGFQAIAAAEPERCQVIDASLSEDAVHDQILAAVADRLG